MSWFLLAAAAHACECDTFFGPGLPADGDAVPSDASVVIEASSVGDVVLLDADGQTVPVVATFLPVDVVILAPLEPLTIGAVYTVSDGDEWGDSWSFTVSDERDTTAPDGVEVVGVEEERRALPRGGACESAHTVRVQAEAAPAVWYEFEASEEADFADPIRVASVSNPLHSGQMCGGDIPGLPRGGRTWWRVRAVDAVGNVSDWSEPLREGHECACSAAPGAGWWSLLVAGALAARRRGERPRPTSSRRGGCTPTDRRTSAPRRTGTGTPATSPSRA